MIATVIFDFDNTLFDTRAANYARFNAVAHALELPGLSAAAVAGVSGKSGFDAITTLFPGRVDAAVAAYRHVSAYPELVTPCPGTIEALAALTRRGIRCAIATNRRERYMAAILDRFGLLRYIRVTDVITRHDEEQPAASRRFPHTFLRSKPDPECILLALSVTGTAPPAAVYVGDTQEDRQAAAAAGVAFVAFANPLPGAPCIMDHRELLALLPLAGRSPDGV